MTSRAALSSQAVLLTTKFVILNHLELHGIRILVYFHQRQLLS